MSENSSHSPQPADDFPSQQPEPIQPQDATIAETPRPAQPEVTSTAEVIQPAQEAAAAQIDAENASSAWQLKPEEREHMPAWLRAQIIDDVVQSSFLPESERKVEQVRLEEMIHGATTSEPQSEVERLRSELARSQSETARYRQQLQYRSSQETSYTPEHTRGGCLTAWLVVQSIGVALGGVGLCTLLSQEGGALVALIGGALLVLTAISIYGVWNLRKWGFYMQLTLYLLGIGGSLLSICTLSSSGTGTATGAVGELIGSIIGLIIFGLLVQQRWEMFE